MLSTHGLVTTVAYKLGKDKPAVYALEGNFIEMCNILNLPIYGAVFLYATGSVAVAGSALKWLQNNLKILKNIDDSEQVCELMT